MMLKLVDSEVAYRGYATVTVLTLSDEAGVRSRREVVDFGRSACVLPYDPGRRMAMMVRAPRAPLLLLGQGITMLEAPAGMIGDGESPEGAIRREAMEEVGLELGTLEPVAECWPSPGVLAETTHLYLAPYGPADRIGPGGGLADEHEGISVEETPLAKLWGDCLSGRLRDLKTLALTLALYARRPDLFEPARQ
jgi:nudix-type nucleoside diphosphatase (YffH/AdpP family)